MYLCLITIRKSVWERYFKFVLKLDYYVMYICIRMCGRNNNDELPVIIYWQVLTSRTQLGSVISAAIMS